MMTKDAVFVASTGRTATMFLAETVNQLDGIVGLHEGHDLRSGDAVLPVLNVQNRAAWSGRPEADSVVSERRNREQVTRAAAGGTVVDTAFYNSPLLPSLSEEHPDAALVIIVRRCEGFVRSATIVEGEDLQPAGWPAPDKPLTGREQFISLGRHRPARDSEEAEQWRQWSGISRNIWLWSAVNRHLADCANLPNATLITYELLREDPAVFWQKFLTAIGGFTDTNLAACVAKSGRKVNSRTDYQIPQFSGWSDEELDLYYRLAQPVEERIYGSGNSRA